MSFNWVWITVLGWLVSPSVFATPEKWLRRSTFLDEDRRFRMEWEVARKEEIIFRLEVRTRGLVVLGFSKDGTMANSDVVVAWVSEGQVYFQDRHGEGNRMPELDHSQDYELISGSENATHTSIAFKRKWNTCDNQDFEFEHDNTVRVMHAYTYEDPVDRINIPFQNFVSSAWKSLVLMEPDIPMETDVEYWDVVINNFTVSPEWDTMYWCKLFRTPELDQKHHVTRVEQRVLGGNQGGYVHHIFFYECPVTDSDEYERYVGEDGFNCLDPNAPRFTRECFNPFAGWAKGGVGYTLPDHIGAPLDPEPVKYYMLQVHFDNERGDTGTLGGSGLRLHHTSNLRPVDAGTLTIGLDVRPNVMAPPGVPDFVVAGHAHPECTGPVIPKEGIRIYSACLHTHLIGRRLKVRHFRNNTELPPLIDNKYFDPEYQQYHKLEKERVVLPWDQLTLECTYDSTNRNITTFGGFSTRDEMCVVVLVYYPKIEGLSFSFSLPQKSITTRYLGSQELMSLTSGETEYSQTFVEYMSAYNWNRTAIRRFERNVRFSDQQHLLCSRPDYRIETPASYPEGLKKYVEPPSCPGRIKSEILAERKSGSRKPFVRQNVKNTKQKFES